MNSQTSNIIFLFRLSAIGDIVIAARTVQYFVANGYVPIFVSSEKFKDVLFKVIDLKFCICFDDSQKPYYYYNGKTITQLEFKDILGANLLTSKIQFCDLQNRMRSLRARQFIKNEFLNDIKVKTYKFDINLFHRNSLLLKARFSLNQNTSTKKHSEISTIHDGQLRLINKIFKNDQKKIIHNHSQTPYLKAVPAEPCIAKYFCVFPGASGPLKEWPVQNYVELVKELLKRTEYDIYVCGGKAEFSLGSKFNSLSSRVQNRIGLDRLGDTLEIIASAEYVFCNDSFPTHVADAYQVPATVVFGGTSPSFGFIPVSPQISVKYQNFSCSPCTRHGKGKCRFNNLGCLTSIKPADIFEDFVANSK